MLVTDPRNRASLQEILCHPWILKGSQGPPENHLAPREPLSLPLDPLVINGMTGFEFGTSEAIHSQLIKILSSDEYQYAVRNAAKDTPLVSPNPEKRKGFGFDFYKRRSSTSSKDALTNPSSEVLAHPSHPDPVNAYHPLVSVYFLVREKLERDRLARNPPTSPPFPHPDEKLAKISIPKQPEAAHTSETSYEFKGESVSSGGRTRPRARTHGDDEVSEAMKKVNQGGTSGTPSPVIPQHIREEIVQKKESTVGGMLRRFSTRRHHSSRSEASKSDTKPPPPPTLSLQPPSGPEQADIATPRKSLSVRRPPEQSFRSDLAKPGSVRAVQPDLLTPPTTADGGSKRSSKLGRSTSVTEADWRRKYGRGHHGDPPSTGGSERSISARDDGAVSDKGSSTSKPMATRAKSLSHSRRGESFMGRRMRREEAATTKAAPNEVPQEDGGDVATSVGSGDGQTSTTLSSDYVKPVFLKGLFSVATTSTKPPIEIRHDIIRVLTQLGVSFKEIRGGFTCVHRPSIDLKSVQDNPPAQSPEATNMVTAPPHRRKPSFGGVGTGGGAGPSSPQKPSGKRSRADTSYTNSDVSNESMHDGVLGGSLILQFEIYIVKVPLLALHGIQFKSVNKTNTWQYKSLASRILSELRL